MSDKFAPLNIKQLYEYIFSDSSGHTILGIPAPLFFNPKQNAPLHTEIFDQPIATPFGVAAGPHSQMAQNIIAAWLCGARYIELKTVQTLDELKISKPCIDMQDEGYNCEWSQELKIEESFSEYLKAWIFIHLISHKLGYGNHPHTVFNMSVGYNYEGICNENVQWFLNKMKDCTSEKEAMINSLAGLYPEIKQINIPSTISDNITLSTMHGCPPEEIEKIGRYFIEEKKLHTFIKLNPTLLGAEELRRILNTLHHHKTTVPDEAFEHDLKYENAVSIIKSLTVAAQKNNVFFGIKLTNTLESLNHRHVFNPEEKMMYMSGKALHPLSVNIARKLQNDFHGQLNISFSGGADCFNISRIIESGIYPVTVSSDLLKPGGYGRLYQYAQSISDFLHTHKIQNLSEYFKNIKISKDTTQLNIYAEEVLNDKQYSKDMFSEPNIKTGKKLSLFDCISAPCVSTCPTNQDIPDYLYYTSEKKFDDAMRVILKTNPLPAVCGMVCDHECQSKCTRINFDDPLMIREIKRFITEQKSPVKPDSGSAKKLKVAIIGAGPSGLSCGFFLALEGFQVTIHETKAFAGGMVSDAIPEFRLSKEAINSDIERIKSVGVKIIYESKIDKTAFKQLQSDNDFIFIAIGAQKAKPFNIEGSNTKGFVDPLEFLSAIKKGIHLISGNKVAVVGGGNTAFDVARTAKRIVGPNGKVSMLYRRTIQDMPADAEEIKAALAENIEIIEYVLPEKILSENNNMTGLVCSKMKPGLPDASGRAAPVKIEGSEFEMKFDTLIPALGQDIVMDFIEGPVIRNSENSYMTQFPCVFIGGDAMRGASTVIRAVADGRKAAAEIINKVPAEFNLTHKNIKQHDFIDLMTRRSLRQYRQANIGQADKQTLSLTQNNSAVLTEPYAITEAGRCLNCDELCNICVTVCPNRANFSYQVPEQKLLLQKAVRKATNEIVFEDDGELNVLQQYQVLNIADFCNECGNCTSFCPTSGKPFSDKPRFFINISKFNESDYGFYLKVFPDKITLIWKSNEEIKTLTLDHGKYIYEDDQVQTCFLDPGFEMIYVKFFDPELKEYHFREAAEMYVLLQGMKTFKFLQ